MDIAQVAPVVALEDEGTLIELHGPDGEPAFAADGTPVTLRVAGTYSKRYKAAERAEADALLKAKKKQPTPEEVEGRMLRLAAACVIDWAGITDGGAPLPCTKDNVVRLLTVAPWVLQQVLEAMQDHARFFTPASVS